MNFKERWKNFIENFDNSSYGFLKFIIGTLAFLGWIPILFFSSKVFLSFVEKNFGMVFINLLYVILLVMFVRGSMKLFDNTGDQNE